MSKLKIRVLCVSVLSLNLLMTGCYNKSLNGTVPDDWYSLPEHESQIGKGSTELTTDETRAANSIDTIFATQASTLSKIDNSSGASGESLSAQLPLENRPPNWVPWHLDAFLTDISVTISGALGVLMFDGSKSVEVLWKPAQPVATRSVTSRHDLFQGGGASVITVSANDKTPLTAQLEPAIRGALATGRIKDESKLRSTLSFATRDFENVVKTLSNTQLNTRWDVVGYRMIITVDASGTVTPEISAGGTIFVRFDWFRDPKVTQDSSSPKFANSPSASGRDQLLSKNLINFTRSLSQDLDEVSHESDAVTQAGFKVAEVRFGLGITVAGDIGVVSTSGSVVGIVQFAPSSNPVVANVSEVLPDTISFLTTNKKQIALAQKLNTFSAPSTMRSSNLESGLIRIDRSKLRKGIRKAARLGAFFVRHAQKAKSKKWAIAEVVTAYEMSVSGTIGLVTVSGTPSLEILHTRIDTSGGTR